MGLDMYLYHRTEPTESDSQYLRGIGLDEHEIKYSNIECMAYWRKANAIHGWFIENIAEGIDNCKPIKVTSEDLECLLDEVHLELKLKDTDEVGNLEPYHGFFFGSYERDEYYYEYLEETVPKVEGILKYMRSPEWDPVIHSIIYWPSW